MAFSIDDYEEMITTIGELKEDDLIFGTDNEWHSMRIDPVNGKKMYNFTTDVGNIICSYDHRWNLYKGNINYELPTHLIAQSLYSYQYTNIGNKSGPLLLKVEACDREQFENNDNYQFSKCITIDNEDREFEILTDEGNKLYTNVNGLFESNLIRALRKIV